MATYYGIFGQKVQYLASDPSDVQIGQVWYNSTSATLKVRQVTTTGTFASGGNMNTGRVLLGSAGTQTAALAFGGSTPYTDATEKYNGTSWTNNPTGMNTPRGYLAGCGTQTAALGATGYGPGAGSFPTSVETFDGSTWSPVSGVATGRAKPGISGTQTAALIFGGSSPFPGGIGVRNLSESWNGSSWTTAPVINTARFKSGSAGTQTAALMFGGSISSPVFFSTGGDNTESYNGTSWTSVANLPHALTSAFGGNGTDTQSFAISVGNDPGGVTRTSLWNGTSWTANPTTLATPRSAGGKSGSATAGLFFGGGSPPAFLTEEWTGPGVGETKTVTVS